MFTRVAAGRTVKSICAELGRCAHTINHHIESARRKTGARSRCVWTAYALEARLLKFNAGALEIVP